MKNRGQDMDKLTVSVLSSGSTWFGGVVDDEDRLVTSTFSSHTDPTKRLRRTVAEISDSPPRFGSHPYSRAMSKIYDGHDPERQVKYNQVLATAYQRRVYEVLKR